MKLSSLLFLVSAYIRFHPAKSMLVIISLVMMISLPGGVGMIVDKFEDHLKSRSEKTPFVLGREGSQLDLVLHSLYFLGAAPGTISYGTIEPLREENLASIYPMLQLKTASKVPVVGIEFEYLGFRGLRVEAGRPISMLGEAVVGWSASKKLGISVGDSVITDAENVFDIAGAYPLKLKICGILEKSGTPDDDVIFTGLKTAWIIEGIGHGHQPIDENTPGELLINNDSDPNTLQANAAVLPYTEITSENIAKVHFHGDPSDFPISAALVIPPDNKASSILEGRFLNINQGIQLVDPKMEIDELLSVVFQIKSFFEAQMWIVTISTFLLIGLVISLSLRLRTREMATYFVMGCSKSSQVQLLVAEVVVYILISVVISAGILTSLHASSDLWLEFILNMSR